MSIQRTFEIDDITPKEMAEVFLSWAGDDQAAFFNVFKVVTDTWPGAGWCQQCCAISEYLDGDGIESIAKLAEWAAEPYRKGGAA